MAIPNDEKTPSSESSLEAESPNLATLVKTPRRKSFYFLSLIVILALSIASLALFKTRNLFLMQAEQESFLKNNLTNIDQAQTQFKSKISQNLSSQEKNLQSQIDLLSKQMQAAKLLFSSKKPDWMLLKAKYYLELAQINAKWSQNQDITVTLLEQADGLLQEVNQQALLDVRQSIAKEILELKSEPKIDLSGLLAELNALQAKVPSLEIKSFASPETEAKTLKPQTWRHKLQESLKSLSNLVVIRHDDSNYSRLFSPRYELLLRENLRMDLKQVQWAILEKNQKIYESALSQALDDLNRSFKKSANTDAFATVLENLRNKELKASSIKTIDSLKLLTNFLDSPQTETPGNSEGDKSS